MFLYFQFNQNPRKMHKNEKKNAPSELVLTLALLLDILGVLIWFVAIPSVTVAKSVLITSSEVIHDVSFREFYPDHLAFMFDKEILNIHADWMFSV